VFKVEDTRLDVWVAFALLQFRNGTEASRFDVLSATFGSLVVWLVK